MDKTVESSSIAMEGEINRWNGFARALRKPDREAFDELMDMCRSYASEASNATNPTTFEPMIMSILLAQQIRIQKLERQLEEALQKSAHSNFSHIKKGFAGEKSTPKRIHLLPPNEFL
jgi:hypothetical protein